MTYKCLVDGNSIGYAAHQRAGMRLTAGNRDTTGIFGALTTMRKLFEQHMSSAPIVLWDGRSWRKDRYPEYKANRVADPAKVAEREAYKVQRRDIARGLQYLGVPQLIAANMEADDLASIVSRRTIAKGQNVVLVTGDKDWLQIVRPGVMWVDHKQARKCAHTDFEAFTGCKSPKTFIQMKALMGDVGDNVPVCGGVGEKGALDLFRLFGDVDSFLALSVEEVQAAFLADGKKKVPVKYQRLYSDQAIQKRYRANLELVDLAHPTIPAPERLQLIRKPLDEAGFRSFCGEFAFISILNDFDRFMRPFRYFQEQAQ